MSRLNHKSYLNEAKEAEDRKSTRLNSSHSQISYAVFCLKKKNNVRKLRATSNRSVFFFNDTATTEIYTLSLHDALPISTRSRTASPRNSSRSLSPLSASLASFT